MVLWLGLSQPRTCFPQVLVVVILAALLGPGGSIADSSGSRGAGGLEAMRDSGDLIAQREHAWMLLEKVSQDEQGRARFEAWHGAGELFGATPVTAPGIRGFTARDAGNAGTDSNADAALSADIPVISYTLYNEAAYQHIRKWGLNRVAVLRRLQNAGPWDSEIRGDRSIPNFPAASMVLKSVWWPVARDVPTALPVWDPAKNPPRSTGNGYTSWQRVVAIADEGTARSQAAPVSFLGRSYTPAATVPLSAFHYVVVDASMERALQADPESRRTGLMALGRLIEAGDYLVLVAANLATKEIQDWVWATYWWTDRPTQEPFGQGRPAALRLPWRNYLMQVAFDAAKPLEEDGGAHICFNPWLEGRFPDGGHGSGLTSNCQACHRRASFPAVNFLPVTRGNPERATDPAYAPGRLRTGFLWSIALHAR